jgi:hypothetical protein
MELTKDKLELKQLFKDAVIEALAEHPDLISDAVEDALEDRCLAKAMEMAREEGLADKKAVARILGLKM